MTLQQVTDFLSVVQHGSLHAAARATGQTQPALTKSLHRLEAALGTPLFDRHAKGVVPNESGRRFLGHARRLVAEAQRVLRDVGGCRVAGRRLGARELLGERDAVDGDVAVRVGLDTGLRSCSTIGVLAHRCFTPSDFV